MNNVSRVPRRTSISSPKPSIGKKKSTRLTTSSSSKATSSNIRVVVRVRPFTPKEIKNEEKSIVQMNEEGKETILLHPTTNNSQKFTFDRSFWSFDPAEKHFASQETVYNDLGKIILSNAWKGYNASLFAYGQTGSGKTFSTFGSSTDFGIIPRLCHDLFRMIEENQEDGKSYTVEASMLEIYSERVRDLLDPTNPQNETGLRIRESQQTGPYVEGLCLNYCSSAKDLLELLDQGQKYKTIASTSMNDTSSRAHTIFQLYLTQTTIVGKKKAQKRSIISLIDLAGSERVSKAQTSGQRLKEGAAINLSLTMLGSVINKLAENKDEFVPYRNSVLTYLLKESLGGNAKTIMISTISPAASNYEESLSTLQYANRAKNIKNKAKINEDSHSRMINELKAQIEMLKMQLLSQSDHSQENERLRMQLLESQRIMEQMGMTDKERELLAREQREKRNMFLQKAGIIIADRKEIPHFVNLNEDISLNECLLYFFKMDMDTSIGSDPKLNDIFLQDPKVKARHCIVSNSGNDSVFIAPLEDADIYVNGTKISSKTQLHSSDRVLIGAHQVFRFTNPKHPSNDNRIIDIQMAREEIEKRIELEFAQKREERLQELDAIYDKKQNEHELKISHLEKQRQILLEEIQNTQKLQLAVVNRTHKDTEDIKKLETDVSLFQKKLKEEQNKQKLMEQESAKNAEELSAMRDKLLQLTQSLQKEQAQRQNMQLRHESEMRHLQEQQQKIRLQSEEMNHTLIATRKEKDALEKDLLKHKEAHEKSEKQLFANLTEQAELLPVLQSIMMEQERTMRSRIDELSNDLAQKVSELEALKQDHQRLKMERVNQHDEFLVNVLSENEKLKVRIQQQQAKSNDSSEEQQIIIRTLQKEISRYRTEKLELERKITEMEMKLNQKEVIIRALRGDFD